MAIPFGQSAAVRGILWAPALFCLQWLIKTRNVARLLNITDTQCRAARGILNWSTRDPAKVSHVGATTIARFESGKPANPSTLALLKQAFEAHGVRFKDGGVFPPEKEEGSE